MPNIKSAEKRVRIIEKKTMQNRVVKTGLKNRVKKFNAAIGEKDAAKASELLKEVSGAFDTAVAKGTIHKKRRTVKNQELPRL